MKCILLLVVVLTLQDYAASTTSAEDQKLHDIGEKCRNVTGLEKDALKDDLKILNLATSQGQRLPENDDKAKQFIVCFYTKMGIIDAQGVIQKDNLKNALNQSYTDKAKVDKIVDKCAVVQKPTPVEKAYELFKCLETEIVDLH